MQGTHRSRRILPPDHAGEPRIKSAAPHCGRRVLLRVRLCAAWSVCPPRARGCARRNSRLGPNGCIYPARRANPGLQDAASQIPPPNVQVLSRNELVRYRVETTAPYESDWMQYQEPRGAMRWYMLKAVTEARGAESTEFRTTNLRMTCAEGRPTTSIEYQREAASNEIDVSTVIRIAAGTDAKTLQRTTPMRGDDRYQIFADQQFVQKAITAGRIVVTETFSPRN